MAAAEGIFSGSGFSLEVPDFWCQSSKRLMFELFGRGACWDRLESSRGGKIPCRTAILVVSGRLKDTAMQETRADPPWNDTSPVVHPPCSCTGIITREVCAYLANGTSSTSDVKMPAQREGLLCRRMLAGHGGFWHRGGRRGLIASSLFDEPSSESKQTMLSFPGRGG